MERKYWWLVANPQRFSFGRMAVGEEHAWSLFSDSGRFRGGAFKMKNAQVGDLVIGYESKPLLQVTTLLEVAAVEESRIIFRKKETLETPLQLSVIKENEALAEMDYLKNHMGTYFSLRKEEYEKILSLCGKNPVSTEGKRNSLKIVSWNCNGGFRKKYDVLFSAFPDADLFIVQECENPDFYNSKEYKRLFLNGFHVGLPNYFMKGIGVFSPKGLKLRRTKCAYPDPMMMLGYAPFVLDDRAKILAVWPHGKYVEEMIDFFAANEDLITDDLLIIGDTNSATEFNNHHPKKKNHTVMVNWLAHKGLADAYNYFTSEAEGEESVPTFYLQRKKEKPYHLDRAFAAPSRIKSFIVAPDHDFWLQHSDHIPVVIEIE